MLPLTERLAGNGNRRGSSAARANPVLKFALTGTAAAAAAADGQEWKLRTDRNIAADRDR